MSSLLFWLKSFLKGINMEEVIIKFLDIATIKFIGTPELIELVKKYYPGLENKKAKAGYVKEMIDSYQRFGPYMVMAPGLALPHARPGGNVKEPCISFVKLKEPVCFHHPCNDPVWVVFALGGVSDDGHIELLQDLSSLLAGERMIEKLAALNTYEELEKLMEKEARR